MPEHLTINVDTTNLIGLAPLHHIFESQLEAQPAFLEINPENKSARFDYSGVVGFSTPANVYHGLVVRIPIPSDLDGRELKELPGDSDFIELLERIIGGHHSEWNGSNFKGHLNYDAMDAEDELREFLLHLDRVAIYDAREWFNWELHDEHGNLMSQLQIAQLTDERIKELATYHKGTAADSNEYIYDVEDAIDEMRNEARADLDE